MEKNKVHSFMDNLNLLLVGAVLGCIVGACFMSNYHTGKGKKAEKKIEAYEQYYKCTVLYYFYIDRVEVTCYNKRRC